MTRPFFTVFTPTYNRARYLPRVYRSLVAQTFTDFEWLVVDDGSTDNTRELVQGWKKDSPFPVHYFWQPNQHKKVAFNRGVREARGEMLVVIDSDDELVPHSLAIFHAHWMAIPVQYREQFAGVGGLCVDDTGDVVGTQFPVSALDCSLLDAVHRYRMRGEKFWFTRVDVLLQFPFPEDVSGYVPEGVVWMQIALRHKTRFINEVVRIYHQDAQADQIMSRPQQLQAPGTALYFRFFFALAWPWFRFDPIIFMRAAIHFTRYYLHARKNPFRDAVALPGCWLLLLFMPAGWLAYLYDSACGRNVGLQIRSLLRRRRP